MKPINTNCRPRLFAPRFEDASPAEQELRNLLADYIMDRTQGKVKWKWIPDDEPLLREMISNLGYERAQRVVQTVEDKILKGKRIPNHGGYLRKCLSNEEDVLIIQSAAQR